MPARAPKMILDQAGPNPSPLDLLGMLPVPGATFEAETYPKLLRALDDIMSASKKARPDYYEPALGRIYSTLRNYQQILQKETGGQPTKEALQALPSGTRTKDLLVSELKGGKEYAKEQGLKGSDVFYRMEFSPEHIKYTLNELAQVLKKLYK